METLVNLDTGDEAVVIQAVDHRLARADVLEEGLLEKDGTRDVLAETGGGHEELAVSLTVLHSVLKADRFETLAASGVRLVHGEDALASGSDLLLHSETKDMATHI